MLTSQMTSRAWSKVVLCLAAGLGLGFSQPFYAPLWRMPFAGQEWLGLLSLFGYVPLFLVVARENLKSTFWASFLTMTIQYTVILYWIFIALNEYGDLPSLPSAAVTSLLPMVLAIMGSVFIVIGRFIAQKFNISFFVIAPVALAAAEYFRNFYLFGGFPWGNVGYSLGRIDQFLQVASIVGVYGLVFLVGVSNAMLSIAITARDKKKRITCLLAWMALLLFSFAFGEFRLSKGKSAYAPSIRIALLQGNIPQNMKADAMLYARDIKAVYLDLYGKAKADGAELIIWPESAYPDMVFETIKTLNLPLRNGGTIVGATAYGKEDGSERGYVRNSAFLLDGSGDIKKRYDKAHLVPFGEYVPWPMSGIVDKVVPGMGAFLPGTDFMPQDLAIGSKTISIGTTICYEGIFPEISRTYARRGAEVLVNLTNDAWYGESSAPYQHLLMYRLRAVENGLPFLRATNSGISAWIDAYGRVHQPLGLFERGYVVDDVPLLRMRTAYTVIGDLIAQGCLILLSLFYLMAVLPIVSFWRHGQWWKLLLIAILIITVIVAQCYYGAPRFATDESAKTKALLITLYGLLIAIGVLAKSKRTRSVLMLSGALTIFCSLVLAFFESPAFMVGALLGLLIYALAFRIEKQEKKVE